MSKLYQPIRSENPVAFIGRCQFILDNRMQCPKGADWVCIDNSTEPATETQYCRYHAVTQQQVEQSQPQPQTEPESKPEPQNQTSNSKDVNTNVNAKPSTSTT